MLNETIKALRKSKGLSQQELAVKVNVVRQTISKWELDETLPDIRQAKINNLSLDLIYGLPGQTMASWEDTLHKP